MSKCSHESCKYWNKERESCFFFVEGSGEVEAMPCYKENTNMDILMSVSHNSQARESAMKQFYQYYTAIAPNSKIKVNKIHHFLKIDMTEVYFLTEDEYEIWCKGRDYIYHGVPYHSDYPIKGEGRV